MPKPWADEPFLLLSTPAKTDDFSTEVHRVATEMSLAHNVLIRGLNAIYLQAPFIPRFPQFSTSLVPDFLTFIGAWIESIHSHHSGEETLFFPRIATYTNQPSIMVSSIRQHEAFAKGVEDLKHYVDAVATMPGMYEGTKVREIIDKFAPNLMTHLKEEIATLLALEPYGGDKLVRAFEELEMHAAGNINKQIVLPFALGCNDNTFEGGKHHWPPFPFFIPYLADWIFAIRYRGAWRFSPCTMYGTPRKLEFGPEDGDEAG